MRQISLLHLIMRTVEFKASTCVWLRDESSFLIKIGTRCLALEAESPENCNMNVPGKLLSNLWSPICITTIAIKIATSLTIVPLNKQQANTLKSKGIPNITTLYEYNYFIPV
jgi:hypothetical protein